MKYNLLGAVSTIALGAAFGLGTTGAAEAALTCTPGNVVGSGSCSESVTFGPSLTELTNVVLALDKWVSNASAGFTETLKSVVYKFSGSALSTGSLFNRATSSQTFSYAQGMKLTFANGTGAPSNFVVTANSTITSVGKFKSFTLASSTGGAYSQNLALANGPFTLTGASPGGIGGYVGPGTFQALVSTKVLTSFIGGGGNIDTNVTTTATPQIDITYNFSTVAPPPPPSPTPEPASLALLGVGLAGLGAIRRRRKA